MSIKNKFISGSIWTLIGSLLQQLSGFVIFIILASLISPEEFGVVAFAAIFVDVGRQCFSVGIPNAIVRYRYWSLRFASSGFWLSIIIAIMVYSLILIVAYALSMLNDYEQLSSVVAVLGLALLFDAMCSALESKLRREFRYDLIARRSVLSSILSGAAGVTYAYLGGGVWAIVLQRLLYSLLMFAFTAYYAGWMPVLHFSSRRLRYIVHFSTGLIGAQLLSILNSQVVLLVVGLFLGPASLAVFRAASQIFNMVTQFAITPLQKVSLSAFSRMASQDALINAFLRVLKICAFIACPAFIGLGAVASDAIALLFNDAWAESADILAIMVMVCGVSSLNYFLTPALTAVGRTNDSFWYYLWAVIGNTVFSLFAMPWGLPAVAAAQVVRAYIMLPIPIRMLEKGVGVKSKQILQSVAPSFICALLMGGVVTLLRIEMESSGVFIIYRLIVEILAGAVLYMVSMFFLFRRFFASVMAEFVSMLPERIAGKLNGMFRILV